jgi:DNA modification methylase
MDNSFENDDFAKSCRPLQELLDSVRHIEGFPIGNDKDILSLSDPPYYTACPNPYVNDFISRYGKSYDEAKDTYECTPFVGNISEGKTDPIYTAHGYHTKVPYKAIIPFIEHYTKPGDIVFDGFCGTGMTGVATHRTNRSSIQCDLSPAATFITSNYNTPVDIRIFEDKTRQIYKEVAEECGWMYETLHSDGRTRGIVNYIVWSDVLVCPYCSNEYVFYNAAVNEEESTVKHSYSCPNCNANITKRDCERVKTTYFDLSINEKVTQVKQVPVLINYSVGTKKFEKEPSEFDFNLITKIEESAIPYWFPTDRMPAGDESRRNDKIGITHIHHFYTKRNLWLLSSFHAKLKYKNVAIVFQSISTGLTSKLCRYNLKNRGNGPLSGTLYVPSLVAESNCLKLFAGKSSDFKKAFSCNKPNMISCNSATEFLINDNTIDYIFTDPPFGSNIMYSELNHFWESWLRVFTNNNSEAIMNNTQNKGLNEYKTLMTICFKEMNRILKPNRWITVVFHNSKASIWNAIQDSLIKAGFIIAQVTVMDKKQGSFVQVTSAGAVKNDLVINAYKPKKQFEENFLKRAGKGLERDFLEEHLEHLPIEINLERSEQMLYSKMLAHYIQRGFEIRLNAKHFYALLKDNYKLIDGFWFTDKQILKYEEWKKKQGLSVIQEIKTGQQVLFINNERSALVWLYNFLDIPKTFGEVSIAYNKAMSSLEDQIPEPRELLSNNFIFDGNNYRRPRNDKEQEVIEDQREKDLGRAFERILTESKTSRKKLKDIRKEAIVYGFTEAYREKRFQNIIEVAKKLDTKILEENSEINDFVEIAQIKLGVSL